MGQVVGWTALLLAGGALLWQGNETLDKVGTVAKWGVVAGGVYVAGKWVKAW